MRRITLITSAHRVKITFICLLVLVLLTTGCVTRPKKPADRVYREIPAALLLPCELPPAPLNNGELSGAYVVAFKCAELGNRDKQRIKELSD